jgi:hypothetical protein
MLPTLLFLLGFLRPIYGWPFAVLILVGGLHACYRYHKDPALQSDEHFFWSWKRVLGTLLLVFAVLACTGLGAFTFQFFDYKAYDSLLLDFMQQEWPLAYAEAGPNNEPHLLVIYAAYWLVPAYVGKFIGWVGAYYFNYVWACFGIFLAALWFMRIVGKLRVSLVLILLFFGGLDILGRLLTEGSPGATGTSWYDFLSGAFWWSESRGWLDHWASGFMLTDPQYAEPAGGVFFRFYSLLSFLVDGPYHVVPGALIFLMIVHDLWRRRSCARVPFLWSNFLFCSLFFSIGSLPFLAVGIWENRGKGLISLANLAAMPTLFALLAYFASVEPSGRVSGWIWEFQDLSQTWWILLVHYATEFGPYFICLPLLRKQNWLPHPLWLLGCLCFFLLAPWYRIGVYNDFASKIILAAQFVFMLWIAIGIFRAETKPERWRAGVAVTLLLIGSLAPLGVVFRALDFGLSGTPPPLQRVRHFNEMEPKTLILQGKGNPESLFWKHLARDARYRDSSPIYTTLRWDFVSPQEPIHYWIFFVEPEKYSQSDSGLTIVTKGNRPILRRDGMELETAKVGKILIDVDIEVDGQEAEDAAIIAQWATDEQVAASGSEWPFQRWHANQAFPVVNIVSTNSYWRGNVAQMAFYLRVPEGDEREYVVTIREIAFMER